MWGHPTTMFEVINHPPLTSKMLSLTLEGMKANQTVDEIFEFVSRNLPETMLLMQNEHSNHESFLVAAMKDLLPYRARVSVSRSSIELYTVRFEVLPFHDWFYNGYNNTMSADLPAVVLTDENVMKKMLMAMNKTARQEIKKYGPKPFPCGVSTKEIRDHLLDQGEDERRSMKLANLFTNEFGEWMTL